MDFLTKIIIRFKKIKIILVTGKGRGYTSEVIWQVLNTKFQPKKLIEKTPSLSDVLSNNLFIIETDFKNRKIFKKLVSFAKLSQLPVLVATHIGVVPEHSDFFAGDKKEAAEIQRFAQLIPPYGFLILNFDDKTIRAIDNATNLKNFTFGFQEGADFRASDVHTNTGTNFKINYKGKIIPVWQEKLIGKEYIYSSLATSCVGIVLGLNFVEISEALKNCKL
ncbi:hypothetical protein KKE19_03460 [Patescibacteria group bacterium]|nr:hypothetical protein [Patescibacteria group bacterium]MBU4274845.1 hypothetical protein [Patescibacteria group bacterium]MBU4367986.1 hypothetical protein [Patescibacteria group bacterium]MBU4462167.1 hypothetical protein [Patescibacteria group bacterium]MCG2699830.1 hypothetical protein [Candidatus Parcubacteria bacterium]